MPKEIVTSENREEFNRKKMNIDEVPEINGVKGKKMKSFDRDYHVYDTRPGIRGKAVYHKNIHVGTLHKHKENEWSAENHLNGEVRDDKDIKTAQHALNNLDSSLSDHFANTKKKK